MTRIAVLVPVLNRPDRVRPLVESVVSSGRFTETHVLFLVSPGDDDEEAAIVAMARTTRVKMRVVEWEPGPGDYARKINYGASLAAASAEFVFLGADDLLFHPGWAERALACHLETHACVIGTNDLGNTSTSRGSHATHPLVHRDYLECGTYDEPDSGKLLHEGYDHNYVDTEFVATAKRRETWAHATDSHVEHLHPLWGKGARDETYAKGERSIDADRVLFHDRCPWARELG